MSGANNLMNALKASQRLQTARNAVLREIMAESQAHRDALVRKIKDPTKPNVHDNIDYKTAFSALSAARNKLSVEEIAFNAAKKKLESSKPRLGGKRRTHRKRNHKRKCTRRR